MNDAISYQIYDPHELVEEFKKTVFQKYSKSLADDDPLFIEIEMLAMLAENQRNSVHATLQAYASTIADMRQKWDEKEKQAFDDYQKKTETLINTIKSSCHNIFKEMMMEAIEKAQLKVDAKWAEKIIKTQNENLSFFKSLLYICFGLNTAVLCMLLFIAVRFF